MMHTSCHHDRLPEATAEARMDEVLELEVDVDLEVLEVMVVVRCTAVVVVAAAAAVAVVEAMVAAVDAAAEPAEDVLVSEVVVGVSVRSRSRRLIEA
jgi:hypothetical protein